MDEATTRTEALLRREQLIIIAVLSAVVALAWGRVIWGGGTGMGAISMTSWRLPYAMIMEATPGHWTPGYALVMVAMWWTMMIAMMLPSAAPMVLLHARVSRHAARRAPASTTAAPAAAFTAGYLAIWLCFSIIATGLEWGLERAGAVDGMMMGSVEVWLTGGLLVAAGLYQLSPLKGVCLSHCRAPVAYLSRHWRPGRSGAFLMGVEHGAFCLGCCWALMLLLFAGGVMNLLWIAGLAAVVLVEKLAPFGAWLTPWIGAGLIAAGVAVVVGG